MDISGLIGIPSSRIQVMVLIGMCITGIVSFIYVGISMLKRNRQLNSYGINIDKSSSALTMTVNNAARTVEKNLLFDEKDIKDQMISAGLYNTKYARFITPCKYILFLSGSIGYYFLLGNQTELLTSVGILSFWLVVTILLPDIVLRARSESVKQKLSGMLPYIIDLLAICIQSGMTIESSVRYLSHEMRAFDRDLSYMLNRLNDRAQIVTMEEALEELYIMYPTSEFRSFVMTLKQSLKYGASIYKVLTTLAGDIRDEQMLVLEEKIGKLGAKMSVPLILFVMMPVVILIAAPGIMRSLG